MSTISFTLVLLVISFYAVKAQVRKTTALTVEVMATSNKHLQKQFPGRPPAGKGGIAVTRDYIQTTLRLDPDTKELLDALTRLLGRSQRQVMGDALILYVRRLKLSDQELLQGLLRRKG